MLPRISFPLDVCETKLTREFPKKPFVPQDEKETCSAMRGDFDNPGNGGSKKRLLHQLKVMLAIM